MNRVVFIQVLLGVCLLFSGIVSGQTEDSHDSHDGLGAFGQTTAHDNRSNPSLSFIGDLVATWSDDEEGRHAGADGFKLRGAELGFFGAVGDSYEFHGFVFFDDEEVELEEVYLLATDWISQNYRLKAGRFNLDFGKLSPIHDSELPMMDKPSVLQEYIGGALKGTGAEVHWRSPLGEESLIRASLGLVQEADSDVHVILGPGGGHHHEEESEEESPLREFDDFALNGRLTALFDLSHSTTVQIGGSYLHSPERVFGVDEEDVQSVDQSVLGLDLTLISDDDSTGAGYRLQAEALFNERDYGELLDGGTPGESADDLFEVSREEAAGFVLLGERNFDDRNALGFSYNQYEHAEDAEKESRDFGVFFTRQLNENNRIRLEVRAFEDLALEDEGVEDLVDFTAFSLQWTVMLGSHSHGIEWCMEDDCRSH